MFRKASHEAIDLITALLEYTPTQRLSAIEAMCHPFFDDLRDPNTRLPDSRHPNSPPRELPKLFDFSRHGMINKSSIPSLPYRNEFPPLYILLTWISELSIAPLLNSRLVPPHARAELEARGIDIDNFTPLTKEEMIARLD